MQEFQLAKVHFRGSRVLHRRTLFGKEKAGLPAFFRCCKFCLFNDGSKKCGDGFYDAAGFSFAEESGRILAVSHIFVFAPACKLKIASFKLAAVIIDRSISIKHKINSFLYRAAGRFPVCQRFLFVYVL